MDFISAIAVLILVICGSLMMISSMFGGRVGSRLFRFFGGVILFVFCALLFADPLLSLIGQAAQFFVTWLVRIGIVALAGGAVYFIIRLIRNR